MQLTDISLVWPEIRVKAEKALDGGNISADNMYRECLRGRALCFSSDDGVIIVALDPNEYKNDFELLVLLAVGWGKHGAFDRNQKHVDQIARDLGASRVVFTTRRKGWERRLGPEWSLRSVTYVKEVSGDGREK